MRKHLSNKSGFGHHHILLTLAVIALALIGASLVWRSYQAGTLKEDLTSMIDDYKTAADQYLNKLQAPPAQ